MNDPKPPLIDPQGMKTIVAGFGLGVLIMAFFVLLSAVLGQTLLVDHGAIPHQ